MSDNPYMNTNKPILYVVQAMHKEDDQKRGVDPYNTARMRALSLETVHEHQRKEAESILACFETELTIS